jgi:RNA polymerase sigma-70 factor (ECF subfamily)
MAEYYTGFPVPDKLFTPAAFAGRFNLMKPTPGDTTSLSLVVRLREQPEDAAAWHSFVQRYRPRIYGYGLEFGLQPADTEDVTQAVLLKLLARMRNFRYDASQSFRAWLKTVTRHALCDFLAKRRREQGSGDSAVARLLENVQAREGLITRLEAGFDQGLLEEALRRVQGRVPGHYWEVFRLTALEGLSGAEAAARLGVKDSTVYMVKSRVQKQVRDEINQLENGRG